MFEILIKFNTFFTLNDTEIEPQAKINETVLGVGVEQILKH